MAYRALEVGGAGGSQVEGSAEAAVVGRGSPLLLLMPGWTEKFLTHLHWGLGPAGSTKF